MPTIKYSRTRRKNQGAFALFLFFAVEVQRCFPAAPPLSGRPASLVRPSARLPPVRMPFQHSAGAAQNTAKKIEGKGIDYFSFAWYTPFTRGCSSSVELRLPKPIRWVRLPSSAPEKAGPSRVSPFLALRGVECVIAHATGHVHEPAQTLANSFIGFPVPRKGKPMHATPIIRAAGLLNVKGTPPGRRVLSQYLPSRCQSLPLYIEIKYSKAVVPLTRQFSGV